MHYRRQEWGDSLVLEISISACEKSPMGRKPLDWYPLAAVCVCVCVCLCEWSMASFWDRCWMQGLTIFFITFLMKTGFPWLLLNLSFLDSKRYNLKEHLLHLISHIMIKTCADGWDSKIYNLYDFFLWYWISESIKK
jgi:hypothetical protein